MPVNESDSRIITFIRFPLMVGVVWIHCNILLYAIDYLTTSSSNNLNIIKSVYYIFSDTLPRVSVPLFFFISGFLFFNQGKLTYASYKSKLKSRVRSLLIPYILWNVILASAYLIEKLCTSPMSIKEIIIQFNMNSYYWVACQLWFIRDLMVMAILSPLIYLLIKKLRIYGIIILGLLWFFYLWPFHFGTNAPVTFFFFSLGAYLNLNKINLDFRKWRLPLYIIYPLLVLADLLLLGLPFHLYIHQAGIFTGLFVTLCVAGQFVSHKIKMNSFLVDSSFFLFAAHLFIMRNIETALIHLFVPQQAYAWIILYFLTPVLTITVTLLLYRILRKVTPSFLRIITGDRLEQRITTLSK